MRLFLLITLMFIGLSGGYGQTVSYASPTDESSKMLDSVKYVLPEFTAGTVIFNDKGYSNGAVNIHALTQKVHFIDENGDIREIDDNSNVKIVIAKKRNFLNCSYGFIEMYESAGEVTVGELRQVNIISEVKTGAYGSKSESTAIQSVGFVTDNGMKTDLNVNTRVPYIYRKVPYLIRKGSVIPANRKTFTKSFPHKKDFIEQYLKENKVDFENVEQVREFFRILNK